MAAVIIMFLVSCNARLLRALKLVAIEGASFLPLTRLATEFVAYVLMYRSMSANDDRLAMVCNSLMRLAYSMQSFSV